MPESPAIEFTCQALESIDEVEAADWDRLAGHSNPFVSHAFLSALERNDCVGAEHGWRVHHLLLYQGEKLLGACPSYFKSHSYGEFISDWGWADAYERNGLNYYPKLLSGVPFTPASGPRILSAPDADPAIVCRALVNATMQIVDQAKLSSAHWSFTDADNVRDMSELPLLHRTGHQFHWHNENFRDFQDYLDALTSKRRKQIRKERREAAAAPVDVALKHGDELSEREIAAYHRLYCSTYDRKWGYPSLTLDFFLDLAERMPRSLIMILASRNDEVVAGAHLLRGNDALFGRNWGCSEHHRALHFELCYYVGIEYCIAHGLHRFEAGAQGEHKLARGFMPVRTHSFHYIRDPRFREAIDDFVQREGDEIGHYISDVETHTPFRQSDV
jgi:predicted N-acyltransferase